MSKPNVIKKVIIVIGSLVVAAMASVGFIIMGLRAGGYLSTTEFGHVASLLIELNSFHISAEDGLDPSKVDVFWSDTTDYQRGRGNLKPPSVRIIHSGKLDQVLPKEYGTNNFDIYYDGVLVLHDWDQFKLGNWHYHSYEIQVFKTPAGNVSATISAVGQDNLWGPDAPK